MLIYKAGKDDEKSPSLHLGLNKSSEIKKKITGFPKVI